MEAGKDPKARINPAARHDAPTEGGETGDRGRRKDDDQAKQKQGAELNPLDPGGIGD